MFSLIKNIKGSIIYISYIVAFFNFQTQLLPGKVYSQNCTQFCRTPCTTPHEKSGRKLRSYKKDYRQEHPGYNLN